jgi:SAM-dependent methyltransferase
VEVKSAMSDKTSGATGSAPVESQLWGARVNDWAEVQEATVLPLYNQVLDKTGIGPGTKLLDIGCGSGMFCRLAAERGSSVSGFDATSPFIDIAKSRVPRGDFRVGDMESLPYPAASFHVVTGFNSFQYAANTVNALREARRVAAQGAPVALAVWGKPEDCEAGAYLAALGQLLPPPPPGAHGPFALSDEGELRRLVSEAGMTPLEVNAVSCPWFYKDSATALRGLMSAGPAVLAIQMSGEDKVKEAVLTSLEPFKTQDGGYLLQNKFLYILART